MAKLTKKAKALQGKVDSLKLYSITDALTLVKSCATAKFDESIDVAVQLGIDAKKSDQVVRGAVVLPNGTGKTKRVAVFAQGAKAEEAAKHWRPNRPLTPLPEPKRTPPMPKVMPLRAAPKPAPVAAPVAVAPVRAPAGNGGAAGTGVGRIEQEGIFANEAAGRPVQFHQHVDEGFVDRLRRGDPDEGPSAPGLDREAQRRQRGVELQARLPERLGRREDRARLGQRHRGPEPSGEPLLRLLRPQCKQNFLPHSQCCRPRSSRR